ncbi:MAG: hypothetical protein ABFD49_10770 [Armatimonadota bacterium]|nr:hypothetical protein [bacterium]
MSLSDRKSRSNKTARSNALQNALSIIASVVTIINGTFGLSGFVPGNAALVLGAIAIFAVTCVLFWLLKKKRTVVLVVLAAILTIAAKINTPHIEPIPVKIYAPADGSVVSVHEDINGWVADKQAQVYVLVHPMNRPKLWVQQAPVCVGDDHKWQTRGFFGNIDQGRYERFEVIVFAVRENFIVRLLTGTNIGVGDTITRVPSSIMTVARTTVVRGN